MTAERATRRSKTRKGVKKGRHSEILTFKADPPLVEALRLIPNRSEFIRDAILKAFEGACPFCRGAGTMTTNQRRHWEEFIKKHQVTECGECHEPRIRCVQTRSRRGACPAARP